MSAGNRGLSPIPDVEAGVRFGSLHMERTGSLPVLRHVGGAGV